MNIKDAMITCHIRGAMVAILAFSAMTLPAAGQTSAWSSMTARSQINNWGIDANMMLVADSTWQGEFFVTTATANMKFHANKAWTDDWGETDQTNFTPPFSGIAEKNPGYGKDIYLSNMVSGCYRITFNDTSRVYRIDLLYTLASGVNIISNPSFEAQGSTAERAAYWEWDRPDQHGSYWNSGDQGTPKRHNDWRAHSGSCEAAIEAQWWSGRDNYGGWWREGVATPGLTYQGSAWFWADARVDNVWTADMMEIKIEFYDTGGTQLFYTANQFQGINEKWTKKTVSGIAPPGTAWARLVIDSYGNGTQGSLQFDDAELRAIVSRNQDFNLWGTFTSDGSYTQDDWTVSIGKATTIGARSGYCISLPGPGAVSNFVRSPQFVDGVGQITFWYRHSETNTEVAEPVSFIVQKSPDGTSWTDIGSVTNILFQEYRAYSISVYEPSPYYMRIVHSSGTNRLLIDDVTVAVPVDSPRYMDFNLWPDAGTNMGYSTYLNWEVITGRVSTINAKDGKSLLLPANAATTNFLRTPLLAEGYGDISFYYARGTNGNGWAAFAIQSSPDGTNWSTIATVSNIASTGYAQYQSYFYETNPSCLRIYNLTNPATPDMMTLMVDEGFNDAPTPPVGWTFNGIKIYDSDLNSGRAKPSLMFDTSNDYVRTPALSNPTNLSFWLKGVTTGTSNNEFLVEGASGGAWATITNIRPLPTSGTTYSVPIAQSVTNIQFTYKKLYRNAAFDDVIIHGLPQSSQPPQDLLLDEISIDYPVLMRTQNFNAWPTEDSYGTYMFHGWIVNDGMITEERGYDGQVAHMSTASSGQYIQSPRIPEGLGAISFVYARWSTSGAANVYYDIQLSSNGVTWTTNDTINVTSTNYTSYQKYLYDTNSHYVRLSHRSGTVIALFDNISIGELSPRADVIMNNSYTPPTPYTNDPVYLQCSVIPRYSASILAVTSYYRIGTSGAFTALSMVITDRVNYVSASAIPAQKAGTTVQYYVRCDFSGPGSETTSPKYSPNGGATNPASYRIPRNPSGRVWINELNYINALDWDDDTNEFVEICGPAGWDIGGWKIEFYVGSSDTNTFTFYATYNIPSGTLLPNEANGYGFFVLGDLELPSCDLSLTNIIDAWDPYNQISDGSYPCGLRLINEGNGIEQSISYRGPMDGFTRVYAQEDYSGYPDPYSLQLSGTGSNYAGFAWQTNLYTPGSVNVGQTLEGGGPEPEPDPDIPIGGFSRVSSQLSITMTATNGWAPEVWYTTALLPNPQSWIWITTRTVTTNAGLWTIQFAYPAGQNNCCFRVEMLK